MYRPVHQFSFEARAHSGVSSLCPPGRNICGCGCGYWRGCGCGYAVHLPCVWLDCTPDAAAGPAAQAVPTPRERVAPPSGHRRYI